MIDEEIKYMDDIRTPPAPVNGTAATPACLERQCAEAMQQIRLHLAQCRDDEITESQALATLGAELSGLALRMSVHATVCTC